MICFNHKLCFPSYSSSKLRVYAYCFKAEVIAIYRKSLSYSINENAVEQVTSAKSLGVYVDQNVNREYHIKNVSKKIACAIDVINASYAFNTPTPNYP